MLQIVIHSAELYDEAHNAFVYTKEQVLQLEHSLVSLSKWESKWCKPFLVKNQKTLEQERDYVRCMTISQNVDSDVFKYLSLKNMSDISDYINLPMTATTFPDEKNVINREIITAEIIYYWMITLNVPFECQKWHLNKLLTLINVCNIKNQPKKKMKASDIAARNRALNEARLAQLNTKG